MATISDARFAALRTQGFTGSISDMTLQWLQFNGATSKMITDAWREMLVALGAWSDTQAGQRNDAWYLYLGVIGYEGQISDRELDFWNDGGVIIPFVPPVQEDPIVVTQPTDIIIFVPAGGSFTSLAEIAPGALPGALFYRWQGDAGGGWTSINNLLSDVSGHNTKDLTINSTSVADPDMLVRCRVRAYTNTNDFRVFTDVVGLILN